MMKKKQGSIIIISLIVLALIGIAVYIGINSKEKKVASSVYPDTPEKVLKEYIEFAKINNTIQAKRYLSQKAINNIETGANALNKSFDEVFRDMLLVINVNTWNAIIQPEIIEEIVGDTAKVLFQSKPDESPVFTGHFEFVKEDGKWKLDKTVINSEPQQPNI